jgi:hypothetical protein
MRFRVICGSDLLRTFTNLTAAKVYASNVEKCSGECCRIQRRGPGDCQWTDIKP